MTKIPFWATVFTIIGILILCSLGVWQIKRLHWKQAILQKIESVYQTDPASNILTYAALQEAAARHETYLRGTVQGEYLVEKSLRGSPQPLGGQQGSYLYTPLKMQGGGTVLVNRGWVPAGPLTIETPKGNVAVAGLFRVPGKGNIFTPPNIPQQDAWYKIDLAQIAAVYGLRDLASYVLHAEYPEDRDEAALPKPVDVRVTLNNNHLAYAIFWFTMAGVLAGIYVLRFILPVRKAARP